MKCTILGCGGSLGVPQLLCDCYVCTSGNSKNNRTRSSISVESKNTVVLIDASPDFKQQALQNDIKRIDACLITHTHSDHVSGIDDIKPFVPYPQKSSPNLMPVYMSFDDNNAIMNSYGYLFENDRNNVYKPIARDVRIDHLKEFTIGDIKIKPFKQNHGKINTMGFRFGNMAYSTDFNNLPKESLKILEGLDLWIVDCLRFHYSPTHSCYEQTLDLIDTVKPKKAVLTHMAHELDYDELLRVLPLKANIVPAYDGMVLNFN
jgi:phosphoribosyl 1,2-cyclic phosphate phosphodiesterase